MNFDIRMESLPAPHDGAWADAQTALALKLLASEWTEIPSQEAVPEAARALLRSVFGNSPFLGQCMLLEMATLARVLTEGADPVFNKLVIELRALAKGGVDEAHLMRCLRRAKRQAALVIALADIAGCWDLDRVTGTLSEFADHVVDAALAYLLRRGCEAGDLAPAPVGASGETGVVVLGLGKLGARELNYSSDIDLILLFDPEKLGYQGKRSAQEFLVRVARELVRLLQDVTEDGYVLRVDLRLRPDPASTPLALSVLAAETYYEGMGQNWERAAMIKARPIAGDRALGEQFLRNLRPFIWRKHLDFAAIEDIHSIKRQIHAVKGHRELAVAGHNIKIGRGGIREIEFFAQTQQLIWGGRIPELRLSGTCAAIEALARLGRTKAKAANDLIASYRYLRHVEHRLQMIEDRQTQTLPGEGPELDRLALFCGHANSAEFAGQLLFHMGLVEDHYAELFEESRPLGEQGNLVFTGTEDDPGTIGTLQRMGFPDGHLVSTQVRAWHHGRYRATRSARARELLTELMPGLLGALARTADPDMAFRRFDDFLRALPAGVQVFSLLHSNPGLLDLVAEIMGNAPFLAERLSRHPGLLDGLLAAGEVDRPPDKNVMRANLREQMRFGADFQDRLGILCRWTKDHQFLACVRMLRGVGAEHGGAELSYLAEAALRELLAIVVGEFRRQHGSLPGRGLAVAAMGKLGSREMTVTSDLDLIFIYDVPEGIPDWETLPSDGLKPLPPIQYYARLAQRFIGALTAPMEDGKLYDVDMRLRPSGHSGPIASSLAAFERYQNEDAWTWERMALTRARPLAGELTLRGDIDSCLGRILKRPIDPAKLLADARDMRARIRGQHPGQACWDLKHRPGGQVDIDFIAQYLMLSHVGRHPNILRREPGNMLRALAREGLIEAAMCERLCAAALLWRNLQQMMRLLVTGESNAANWREPTRRRLAMAGACPDFSTLTDLVSETAEGVAKDFAAVFAIDGPAPE